MVTFEEKKQIEFKGIVQQVTEPKTFGKSYRVGIKINDQWYSIVGSINTLNKKLEKIEIGDKVQGYAIENRWTTSEGEERIDYRVTKIQKVDATTQRISEKTSKGKEFQQLIEEIKGLREDLRNFLSTITDKLK